MHKEPGRTLITIDDDGKIKESYYVPCIDDPDDKDARPWGRTTVTTPKNTIVDLSVDKVTNDIAAISLNETPLAQYQKRLDTAERQIDAMAQQLDSLQTQYERLLRLVEVNHHTHHDEKMPLICVTGQFVMDHRELAQQIQAKGLRYSETVTRDCDYLIASPLDHKSQKRDIAMRYDVPIRDYPFLLSLMK